MSKSRRNRARFGPAAAALVAGLTVVLAGAIGAGAQEELPSRFILVDPHSGLAMGGYDPVAYFVDRRPRQGRGRLELVWSGVTWRFVNEGNRAAFAAAPQVYAPRFGGFDARLAADGVWAQGDPTVWAIHRQRLFLFFSPARRFAWLSAPERFVERAERHWEERLGATRRTPKADAADGADR